VHHHSPESNCRRKIRHENYLSALRHAVGIPDNETIVIYPCPTCLGIHCGHGIDRASKLIRKLARTEQKIALARSNMKTLVPPYKARNQQRLKDLGRHAGWLKTQIVMVQARLREEDETGDESPLDETERSHGILQFGSLQGPCLALRLPIPGGLLKKIIS
jgi:hypothetical protein